MIEIKNIRIEKYKKRVRLVGYIQLTQKAIVSWEKNAGLIDKKIAGCYQNTFLDENYGFDMWYDVPIEYEYSLCYERSDAFLIASLYFAIVTGEDIMCEKPVTEKLFYQIQEYIIPALCKEEYRKIKIIAECADECEKIDNFIGTGISCGVDSFSTILLHLKNDTPLNFKLTHLTLFNTGSMNFIGYKKNKSLEKWRKETIKEFIDRINIGKKVAHDLGLKFLDIDTNIPDIYQGAFLYSHTYRNCSAVLATQKIWKYYYYSSAGEGMQNEVGMENGQGSYDLLNLPCISLENLHFYSAGVTYKRLQKLELIADNPVVKKYINVCTIETHNCGRCPKCIRTLLALELLGKIDEFKNNFQDMSFYSKYKWKFMGDIMEATPEDYFNYEMKQYIENNHIKYGMKAQIYHYLLPVRKFIKIFKR